MLDQESNVLCKQIADMLKPRYQFLLEKGNCNEDYAFTSVYNEAVIYVSKIRSMSEANTKFFSRDVLQEIMHLVVPSSVSTGR